MSRSSPLAFAFALAAGVVSVPAHAERRLGFHVAYAPGLAAGYQSGFRHQLDAGALAYLGGSRVGNRDGMWSRGSGTLLGGALLTGFGAKPTYGFAEVGYGTDTTLAGVGVLFGPAVRVDGDPGGGATLRVAADVIAVQVGVRLVWTFIAAERDGQIALTLGLGRF